MRGLDDVGDASVYGTLRRLYSAGALTSYVVPSESGPHRKYYGINAEGRALLKTQRDDWDHFAATISDLLRTTREPAMNTTEEITRRLDVADYVDDVKRGARRPCARRPRGARRRAGGRPDRATARDRAPPATPAAVFGSAAAYAAELREAAGYPTLPSRGRAGWGGPAAAYAIAARDGSRLLATPSGSLVVGFLEAHAPGLVGGPRVDRAAGARRAASAAGSTSG